jgi:phosphocarrier protein
MMNETVTVINKTGLHARPANTFVKEVIRHKNCNVSIRKDGKLYNAKSIVSVLLACVKCGDEIDLVVDGESEQQTLADLIASIQSGLGE